ncbi:MAG: site-specific DNA-methyltransferase [bacterium]|nr:site-specific DNA-methyltransferase [bacterium]
MENLLETLKELLKKDERLIKDGELFKNKIIELALKLDKDLLKLLLSDEKIKEIFFFNIEKMTIFDKDKFIRFISNKHFLPDSYTSFKNKIGLIDGDEYITEKKEVVLAWPYKDCVLEGGMTKEDQKRDEIFYNETLAPDEISRLLDPKVFTNAKRLDRDGEHPIKSLKCSKSGHGNQTFKTDENGDIKDNLIIKGNNLLALHSLKERFAGKIKLIYIDPPYNQPSKTNSFQYNNLFNHSTWLTFMKNRIRISKDLLLDNGTIWINVDDTESHYLKIICDEIFGRENFIINFIWQKKYSPANDAKWFSDNHDHILVFAKSKERFKPNLLKRTEKMNKRYSNPDNDPRGEWKPGGFSVKTYSSDYDYPIKTPSGKVVYPPKGSCWQTSKENYLEKLKDNRIWFGPNNDSKPQIKQFLNEVQQGVVCKSIWTYDEVAHNQISRKEITDLFNEFVFSTPKPEKLLKRIIELSTKKNDIVLDYCLGSGTTCAVAHKMGRQYIGIEQMNYIEDVSVERIKKVISGEQGGISKLVNWKGGGDFIYLELLEWNERFSGEIQKAKTKGELKTLWEKMKYKAFLSYKVDIKKIDENIKEFEELTLEKQKQFMMECLDKNHLYVNYSEIEDEEYKISEEDKELNREFYKK